MRCVILEGEEKLKQTILNMEIFVNLVKGYIDFIEEFEKAEEIHIQINDEAINGKLLLQNTITACNEIVERLEQEK